MKNIKSVFFYKITAFTTGFFFTVTIALAQSSEETIAKYFDRTIGNGNLEINNGNVHVNDFQILNNKNCYYPSEKFENGNITYNNQNYYDLAIKYDLYKDILVYKPQASDVISINLNPEKTSSFYINKKKFIYINSLLFPLSPIKSGYYEENISEKNFTFYIKHHRDRREIIKETSVLNEFNDNYEYYIKKDGSFYKISAKKDLIKLFPERKKTINEFYSSFRKLEDSNEPLFYEKLMTYLHNDIENNPI